MVTLTTRSPALRDDCLACASPTRWMRKAVLHMRRGGDSVSIHDDDALLAVAYLWPLGDGWTEFCLAIRPDARTRMRALIRLAQLRLQAIAQTGMRVKTHVRPGHLPGERMARLTGFVPDPETPGCWVHVWRL
ncbi:hypothetical protein H1W37_19440 [Stappia taiwanensis]|uniref:GNAT family N-acetyltransferase n=1 Tax=Stappia taiwanensis TaxID=992267 RepID=A0A838XVS8_9HYPH|nr:hypothetical protein [Stappia taiwanensis]MBA4613837.1 hypothetical protein [Stappia taiwanensis]GGE79164.1 hypothetical protein GCM10007285_03710 [Stappia taiwanensis]